MLILCHIQREASQHTKPTYAIYSLKLSCQWLHSNGQDCTCLSTERPQNWILDKKKVQVILCRYMGVLTHNKVSPLVMSDGRPDSLRVVHSDFSSELLTRPADLCCLILRVRLSLLLLLTGRTVRSWASCADTWQPVTTVPHFRRLDAVSEHSPTRFLFSFTQLCGELGHRETPALEKRDI